MAKVSAPESVVSLANQVIELERSVPNLYPMRKSDGLESMAAVLLGKEDTLKEGFSKQAVGLGKKEHPFDFEATTRFQTSNVHHAACIQTKTSSTVGMGFKPNGETEQQAMENLDRETEVDKVINPLCEISFQDVVTAMVEDFWQIGNGLIEVVRKGTARTTVSGNGQSSRTTGDEITGLHHIMGHQAHVYIEDADYHRHYEIEAVREDGQPRRFALFGEREAFLRRMRQQDRNFEAVPEAEVSEVISLRQPSSLSRWYGFPNWLAAVASIELVQCLHQWRYDFFLNRGVPEFLLFITGAKLDPKDWEKIENALKAHIGLGNSHKSLAINLAESELDINLEKLAMDSKSEDDFGSTKENLALDIVSAHRVPPLLAGIQIPGKLGATNELPNALLAFQVLVIGPGQRLATQVLGKTLGNPEKNGGMGLGPDHFRFRRIIDTIDLGIADTVSRMRTPAGAGDRDPADGLRD